MKHFDHVNNSAKTKNQLFFYSFLSGVALSRQYPRRYKRDSSTSQEVERRFRSSIIEKCFHLLRVNDDFCCKILCKNNRIILKDQQLVKIGSKDMTKEEILGVQVGFHS